MGHRYTPLQQTILVSCEMCDLFYDVKMNGENWLMKRTADWELLMHRTDAFSRCVYGLFIQGSVTGIALSVMSFKGRVRFFRKINKISVSGKNCRNFNRLIGITGSDSATGRDSF